MLKVCFDPMVDSLLVSFCCCPHIKVLYCLTDGHNIYDIDGQDRNETDHQGTVSCEGSTTCGEAEGFAGMKLTLANLPDGTRILLSLDAVIVD